MIKKIFLTIGVIVLVLLLWNYQLVSYGIMQGKGQLHILWNAKPVGDYLKDPEVPDSVKQKLLYIQEVRIFAIDQLGLNDTDNYTTMYDQQGKPLLWVVTGCEPYELKAKEWHFPVVGKVPYKGFFVKEKADETMAELTAEGYDAGIRTVGGWSTLGWFKDPILSNMLHRSTGELANLIIHELVHSTIFVKDSVDFNENLASFIADQGTYLFLKETYGDSSVQYMDYVHEVYDEAVFNEHILRAADSLAVLYGSFDEHTPIQQKEDEKHLLISKIIDNLDTIDFYTPGYADRLKDYHPNNTYFMSFLRYRSKQGKLQELYEDQFDKDLVNFITFLKQKHPFL